MHAADMATQPLRGTRLARRTGPVKGPRAAAHRVPPACRRVPTACAADSGDIELPTYDPRTVGQGLQVSCVALSCGAWGKGEDLQKEMDTFVVAVDGGITLFDAEGDATSEALLAQFVSSWEASPAAQLPGAQRPRVCTSIEIPAAATIAEKGADFGTTSLLNELQTTAVRLGLVVPDLCIFSKIDTSPAVEESQLQQLQVLVRAVQEGFDKGVCPANIGLAGFSSAELRTIAKGLRQNPVAGPRVVACRTDLSAFTYDGEKQALLSVCQEEGITLLATDPLGRGAAQAGGTSEEGIGDSRPLWPYAGLESFSRRHNSVTNRSCYNDEAARVDWHLRRESHSGAGSAQLARLQERSADAGDQ